MKIKDFYTEMWLNLYEDKCTYNLSETCVSALSIKELAELSCKGDELFSEIADIRLDYGHITGSKRLKKAISSLYTNIKIENITVAHGGIGANSLALMTLVERGDHVIATTPSYQQQHSLPEALGAEVSTLYLKEENNWNFDMDELRSLIRPNTKLICITNPNNPTGSLLDRAQLDEIVEIARSCGAWIFCDEVYRGLNYHAPHLGTSIADIYERGISTGSMSKTFSLAGLRMGWIVGPAEFIAEIDKCRDYHIISMSSIDDLLASIALENADLLIERSISVCRHNSKLVADWVSKESLLSLAAPVSGSTAFIKYDIDKCSEDLCLELLQQTGVLLVPGAAFDCENHFRLGLGRSESEIVQGMKKISEWLGHF